MEGEPGRGKTGSARDSETISNETPRSTLTRKACGYYMTHLYRKPTQVDEERILRRSGEALLRNSAN